jgi:hypothetical protein
VYLGDCFPTQSLAIPHAGFILSQSDVTLSLSDEDCVELFTGKLNPQQVGVI